MCDVFTEALKCPEQLRQVEAKPRKCLQMFSQLKFRFRFWFGSCARRVGLREALNDQRSTRIHEQADPSMQRGFQLGLLLLVVQLFQEGLGNIPAVTLAVLGFNAYLYVFPSAPPIKACVSFQLVYRNKEWHRLFLSPLHYIDDWHLYFNMASFLWKGLMLERRLGAGWFLYLLLVFSLLTGFVYLLLQALMTKIIEDKDALMEFMDFSYHSNECVVGFSGVLFALKVVSNHYNPGGVTYMLTLRVSNRFASWVELVLMYLFAPGSSVVAHLAGILVGLLYTVGPLKTIMETCAEIVSSHGNNQSSRSYFSSSGYSGTRQDFSEDPLHSGERITSDGSDYTESYIAGLSEEEQLDLAIRRSLNDSGSTPHGVPPTDEVGSPEELLRRRRLRRFQADSTQQRRRL